MPRRYRPPTRRRKPKKPSPYGDLEAPSYQGVAAVPRPAPVGTADLAEQQQPVSHIARDHSHVLGDLRRIAILMAFILGGLIITAILR